MTAHTWRQRETGLRLFKSFTNDAPLAAIDKLTATCSVMRKRAMPPYMASGIHTAAQKCIDKIGFQVSHLAADLL
jgi:hypothetical protein